MVARVQNLGLANVTAALVAYASVPKFLQWGVGSAAAASATTLANTTGTHEARTTGSASQQTTTVANDTFQVTGTITAVTAGKAVTEVGVFDGAGAATPPTGGNLCIYGDFSAINVAVGDSIAFTVQAKFA